MAAGKTAKTAAAAVAAILAVAVCAANVWLGPLNLDEGWYLLAAKNFAAGMRPYRDFFFTQSPLLPAVYGALAPLWAGSGVLGGRILTAALGFAASLAASLAAGAAAGAGRRFAAGLTVFMLLQCNVAHSYFTVIPKTYALASVFVASAFLAFALAARATGARRFAAGAAAGFLLALAAGTRLSLGAMLPAAGLFLLARRRALGPLWLAFGAGGTAGLALAFVPFTAGCRDAFAFANFFHGGRASGGLVLSLGSAARLARNYLPLAFLAVAAVPGAMRRPGGPRRAVPGLAALALVAFAAAFAVHVSAPFPYDDYQTPIMPLAAIAASLVFWESFPDARQSVVLPLFALCAALFAASSPMDETWFVLRKDRFWVDRKPRPDLAVLRETARELAAEVPPGVPVLTQDAYLAVEMDRPVPRGFEMGPFGYFAGLPDDDARRFHVLNRDLAMAAIASGECPVAALSGYAFAMSAPELARDDAGRAEFLDAVAGRYELDRTVPDFGQEHTPLSIWRLRPER